MTRSEESMTRMTSLTNSSGHLCPTPFQIYACKKDSHLCKSFPFISSFLSHLCVAVSLSFARPFAPSKDVLRLSRVTRPYRKPRHMKKDTYICKCLFLYQQLPIQPLHVKPLPFARLFAPSKAVVWHPGSPARIGSFPCKKAPRFL